MEGQLTGEGRLSGTLQARDQDHRRLTFEVDIRCGAPHQFHQFVVDDLDHQLARFDGFQDVLLAQGLILDIIRKLFGDLIVDIRRHQRPPNLFDRLGNIDICEFALSLQGLECTFKPFT